MHHVPTKQAIDQFTNSPKAGQENIEYYGKLYPLPIIL